MAKKKAPVATEEPAAVAAAPVATEEAVTAYKGFDKNLQCRGIAIVRRLDHFRQHRQKWPIV